MILVMGKKVAGMDIAIAAKREKSLREKNHRSLISLGWFINVIRRLIRISNAIAKLQLFFDIAK